MEVSDLTLSSLQFILKATPRSNPDAKESIQRQEAAV